jgi:hypothetical protein
MHRCPDVRRRTDRLFALGLVALAVTATACGSSSSTSPSPASTSQSASATGSATSTTSSSAPPTGSASPQNVTLTLTGKNTNLTLAAATVQALTTADVQISPVAPATAPSPGMFSLPVSGGTLTQVGLKGTVNHSGGVQFTHAGKTVTASNFVLNTVRSTLFATVQGSQIPLLAVDLTHLVRTSSGSEIIASGISSTLIPSAAVLLNGQLATTVYTQGMPIGALTAYLTGKPA